jgi:hypothetical protein
MGQVTCSGVFDKSGGFHQESHCGLLALSSKFKLIFQLAKSLSISLYFANMLFKLSISDCFFADFNLVKIADILRPTIVCGDALSDNNL